MNTTDLRSTGSMSTPTISDEDGLIRVAYDPKSTGQVRRRAITLLHDTHGHPVKSLATMFGLAETTVTLYLQRVRREDRLKEEQAAQRAAIRRAVALATQRSGTGPARRPHPLPDRAAITITAAGPALSAIRPATPLADLADVLVDLDDALATMPDSDGRDRLLEHRHGIWQVWQTLTDGTDRSYLAGAA